MEKAERIRRLLVKQLTEPLSGTEAAELREWLAEDPLNEELLEEINKESLRPAFEVFEQVAEWNAFKKKLFPEKKRFITSNNRGIIRLAAAAVTIAVVATLYVLMRNHRPPAKVQPTETVGDIPPGSDRATLILSDGSSILLDTANGDLAAQNGMVIRKQADGQIVYAESAGGGANRNEKLFNTLSVPRAGKFQILLPDGTKVWLNAATSMRYPVRFENDSRTVELTGEAYFEVNRYERADKRIPFQVKAGGMVIKVLGTRFNVYAYPNESKSRTVLLEGKVVVAHIDRSINLFQGEEAVLNKLNGLLTLQKAHTSRSIDWMNGTISFDYDDFELLMAKIARWYDVEVIYTEPIREEAVSGQVSRNRSLKSVIEMLSNVYDKVDFKLEGRRLLVSPVKKQRLAS